MDIKYIQIRRAFMCNFAMTQQISFPTVVLVAEKEVAKKYSPTNLICKWNRAVKNFYCVQIFYISAF